uniref:ATP-dependent DNA helicase n=1 Tax=Mycena chlorophos TaxID=658473 RepID=A0ABQ0LCP0_MYCCL|nr:predicted protein [Mycena chlorophos]
MIVRGEGGTGKTVLLNAISRSFEQEDTSEWLAKTATTGVAASLFGGQTLHSWAAIPIIQHRRDLPLLTSPSKRIAERRKENILPTHYLVIDEYSMLTQRVLEMLSQILRAVKAATGLCLPTDSFGNVNIILFGDLHQFPPVGNIHQALFADRDTPDFVPSVGLSLYQQFTTVVTLTEQRQVTDADWMAMLRRLRNGDCTEADIDMVNALVVGNPRYQPPSWTSSPWDSAVLVTPRHGARIQWNAESLKKHRARTGNHVYICCAEDIVAGREGGLTMRERLAITLATTKQSGKLNERVEIAVGMRAMVLFNISTEADLANGTRGEIIDIVLDACEQDTLELDPTTGHAILQYPPAAVLFKPNSISSAFPQFEGLPAGVIPVVPSTAKFTVGAGPGRGKVTIIRKQLAMTPGYAFTDYKSQGQTIGYMLIDLGKPPTGSLTPFSAYIALLRSHGRENICILRGFDRALFTTHPSEMLRREDV